MIIFVNSMNKLFLALFSGFLLAFSWPFIGFSIFIFVAFVPLLILVNKSTKSNEVFLFSFIAFFLFNSITTYWVYHATIIGCIVAFIINSLLMASVFWLYSKIKHSTSSRLGALAFLVMWLSMEYLHLNWQLSWPWLTLGNVFSKTPELVQWYEFTGFLGGSFWIIIVNLLVYNIFKSFNRNKVIALVTLILAPMLFSFFIYINFEEKGQQFLDVVIIQPNVNPYTDKFSKPYESQLIDFIKLAKTKITKETQLLLAPETALLEGVWENSFEASYSVRTFRKLQNEFPNLNILVGATTYKMLDHAKKKSSTSRKLRNENTFYEVYNSAIFIPSFGDVEVYHKTKLVPGAERMPFPYILDPLANLAINLGGTSGSLSSDNYLNSFKIKETIISPLICYESVYGEMKLGKSSLIAILTNDGWWKNTAGYKQHFAYSRLRAVEQRKSIIRSANTGISSVINHRGDVLIKSNWDEEICLTSKVAINNGTTFYNRFGDYIGRISVFISSILLIVSFVRMKLSN